MACKHVSLILVLEILSVKCLFLPGLAPTLFCDKEIVNLDCKHEVEVFFNTLHSMESALALDYNKLHFCHILPNASFAHTNFGQRVFGEKIIGSSLKFEFLKEQQCQPLCKQSYKTTQEDSRKFKLLLNAIHANYEHQLIIDNIPVTFCYATQDSNFYCSRGFPVGCDTTIRRSPSTCEKFLQKSTVSTNYIFNHWQFEIIYHDGENESWKVGKHGGRIVSVRINVSSTRGDNNCDPRKPYILPVQIFDNLDIPFFYSVKFTVNNHLKWATRWDAILYSRSHSAINWFSILNSLLIAVFLSGVVAVVFVRTLHRDLSRYNKLDDNEDSQEDFGWKLVHGDVFRPPNNILLLSTLVGSGVQLIVMLLITLAFACLGFLSPARRGALMNCGIICYILLGFVTGYISSLLYKSMGGYRWIRCILMNALFCPGVVLGILFFLNLILWANDSTNAIPMSTFAGIVALWLCVSVPLVFFGSYFGFKRSKLEFPVKTNHIPRQIPFQSFYTRPWPNYFLAAVMPFGCIFVQLFFVFNSIWSHQYFYLFGFIYLAYFMFLITVSETSILSCYLHLCAEDYRWWWRSFVTGGFTAFYLFVYATYFFIYRLDIKGASSFFIYFGYTLIMCFLMFLIAGATSFLTCLKFLMTIYGAVKVD